MTGFQFQTVPLLQVAFGAARRLGQILRQQFPSLTRLAVVTDAGLSQSGLLAPALASLAEQGWQVTVLDEVLADPPEAIVLAAAERARAAEVELIVGLGGGSSMDVAKLLAVLVAQPPQALSALYGINQVQGARLPLVQIPTTAGTGSEVTAVSIVTVGEGKKMGVVAPQLFADIAILDAELSLGLPTASTAATGIDAMVHAIEAYTSRRLKNPLSDMLARQALSLLSNNLLLVCENGQNIAAREAMLLGAMLAGQAFANAPVAAVHALAYPLGGLYHIPHGLSNALVLPHVLRFNLSAAAPHYAELADILAPQASGSIEARAQALIDQIEHLIAATGLPQRLQQLDIPYHALPQLASEAMLQTRLLANNPREMSEAEALEIYQATF